VAICQVLSNKRITTLTTTIFKITRCRIQVTMRNVVINSSQDHSNMTTPITKTWLPLQTTLVNNSNQGDRVAATITILEGLPLTPAIMEAAPHRLQKETKACPLSIMLHKRLRMMWPLLNQPQLLRRQEPNQRRVCRK
jgi:hypothetical protein